MVAIVLTVAAVVVTPFGVEVATVVDLAVALVNQVGRRTPGNPGLIIGLKAYEPDPPLNIVPYIAQCSLCIRGGLSSSGRCLPWCGKAFLPE